MSTATGTMLRWPKSLSHSSALAATSLLGRLTELIDEFETLHSIAMMRKSQTNDKIGFAGAEHHPRYRIHRAMAPGSRCRWCSLGWWRVQSTDRARLDAPSTPGPCFPSFRRCVATRRVEISAVGSNNGCMPLFWRRLALFPMPREATRINDGLNSLHQSCRKLGLCRQNAW